MFTMAEINLMVIYNVGTRLGLITELEGMMAYLSVEEADLHDLATSALSKLRSLSDEEFYTLDLDPDALKML